MIGKRFLELTALVIVGGLSVAGTVFAGDIQAGREKAVTCSGCHGYDGVSPNYIWPNIGGQHRGYLEKQLRDYRSGVRRDPIMRSFVKSLTDEDIEDLATYYSQAGEEEE